MTSNDVKMTSNDLNLTSNEPIQNKRNKIQSGNPKDNQNNGGDLLKQAFSSNYMTEFIEFVKKKMVIYKTKFPKPLTNTSKNRFQQDLK